MSAIAPVSRVTPAFVAELNANFAWLNHQVGIYTTPEACGAAGDGVTDDSAAFQAASNARGAILLDSSKTYALKNVTVDAASGCTGIFSVGGQAHIVPPPAYAQSDKLFTVRKAAGFAFENIFFDMPIGGPLESYLFAHAILINPTGVPDTTGSRGSGYLVNGCRFSGGGTAINALGYIVEDSRFTNNHVSATVSDAMSFHTVKNVEMSGNVFEGCGTKDPSVPGSFSGVIRIGTEDQIEGSLNVSISRNVFTRCGLPTAQSSIDCSSGSLRNLRVTDNILDANGNGIELKTAIWTTGGTPDVYEDLLVANNTIRMVDASGSTGITAHHDGSGPPKGKAKNVRITGNYITCHNRPDPTLAHNAIICTGYDDAVIDNNTIINTTNGISVGGIGPAGNVADNVIVSNNNIDVSGFGILESGAAGTVNGLYIRNNTIRNGLDSTTHWPIYLGLATTDLEISGNRAESLTGRAVDLRSITGGRIFDNTLIGTTDTVITGTPACADMAFFENRMIATAGPALTLSAGVHQVMSNIVQVPLASRTWAGAGTVTAAGNVRGMSAALPVGGGSLGDIFHDSTAATAGWRCTVAHATAATWVVI